MADVLDILTLAEANAALGNNANSVNTRRDDQIALYVTAISRRLDDACGAVVQRAFTEYLDGDGSYLKLTHPAAAFTSVTEYQLTAPRVLTRETVGTVATDGYFAERHRPDPTLFSGRLERRAGGYPFYWWCGKGNIAVVYTAGRYADTDHVDPLFKQAAIYMLKNFWQSDSDNVVQEGEFTVPTKSFPTFSIPKVVRELLRQEWREVSGMSGG